jgi:hypothetical protein
LFQANRIVLIQENLLAETIETYRVLRERFEKGWTRRRSRSARPSRRSRPGRRT